MEKIVKIGNKEYKMRASAFTVFGYKNEFKRDFVKDLKEIYTSFDGLEDLFGTNSHNIDKEKIKDKIMENNNLNIIDNSLDLVEVIFKISYVLIKEADKFQVVSFEDFLKGIDSVFSDTSWISDVIELAVSPF